jgi:hypothetical protein
MTSTNMEYLDSAHICVNINRTASFPIRWEYMAGLDRCIIQFEKLTRGGSSIHRESSSKSSHMTLFSEGARRRIAASLRRITSVFIPRIVTSPRASKALPDKVPGPHIVEVSVVVRCESDAVYEKRDEGRESG